ncbi:beta-lactamase [Mycolicibacterium madagascariense]|uniref:Beta-lactamase n=1 Tax=Mycolicibacterium madagascariense TaxID=212765 RepID=A0A7I7XJK6_9MYCO|nr:class A beta-lactamase [Mycolicibacterium madagascariense]MCV7015914.1 class A beta-lactamase [Mycolicibacterium madagascariense]BBZ29389.1 beta-lactamase [Mycolicibacterium madagascariense]
MTNSINRRTLLGVAMAGVGAVVTGSPAAAQGPRAQDALAQLEARARVRLGVFALDTATQASTGYRADERFLLCSTGKVLDVAAILKRSETDPGLLDRVITYGPSDVLAYAPVTSQHVTDGMTVAALCDAAITVSDNTAANLLVELLGGPPAVTAFARGIGDGVTRVDRLEPDLNVTTPGDPRDTSTPRQMALDLQTLVLGDGLADDSRQRLTDLLKANTTGAQTIRAGLPSDWVVGDKTGSGAQGEGNDVAVAWPPNRPPLLIAIYVAPVDPHLAADDVHRVIAEAARIASGS